MGSQIHSRLVGAGLLLALLFPVFASAQTRPEATPAVRAEARRLFDIGRGLHNQAPLQAALRYLDAYSLYPDCAMLFNAGNAFELGRSPQQAIEQYRRFLAYSVQECPELNQLRGAVQARVDSLGRMLAAATPVPPGPVRPPVVPPPGPVRSGSPPVVRFRDVPSATPGEVYALYAAGGVAGFIGGYSLIMGIRNAIAAGDSTSEDPERNRQAMAYAFIGTGAGLALSAAAFVYGNYRYRHRPIQRVPIAFLAVGPQVVSASVTLSF